MIASCGPSVDPLDDRIDFRGCCRTPATLVGTGVARFHGGVAPEAVRCRDADADGGVALGFNDVDLTLCEAPVDGV